ncbi:acetyl-CoA carboxylase biotin carboxylase subunit [Kordiimonas sp. SCSIO 12603]|uniref:acetyl/propionyl/methylcrotonyl-CoA carboxylase subunit alpha n=1 Tax=Kordiimonas sp. SCSIO 12603 TaxID=2829596 RepID=UPI002104A242|nr:acetyl-CoA carboxylase biotin carboxylase subunit [Kordiimonas sp. SCSIO 12603]UTW58866.1 acetyl-CoA carboxylase biotin carboxylase subunit [Kordiimonas sp. SCSIO 12603]
MSAKNITRILIANRGEIACRVMETAYAQGIETVAVYSDADAGAKHTLMADHKVHIGAAPVGESYLCADKIIKAAKKTGADAIHPGYGFLSENAAFAKACAENGIIFIGPSAEAIDVMGNKAAAKRLMLEADVPCIPGYQDADQSDDALVSAAKEIGYPLMVKAAAGGGGRGMRLVTEEAGLADAIKLARSEAENAFGSGELILEKAIVEPRHVEIQVFADKAGNTIHLGERDCSVQRRHQKVLEEAPCPVTTPELRERMGAAAVAAAKSIGYEGAGTVEFLLDSSGEFYFLEMNTRLQVEHPVTELVTGLDLVAMQIAVAQGEDLQVSQEDIILEGHAIEARLYAEDPANDFLPACGPVHHWYEAEGEGVRVDSGILSGQEISPHYDPMVAKVIAYGETRDVARKRLVKALGDTALFGSKTNKAFLIDCLERESFASGKATTAFIAEEYGDVGVEETTPSFVDAASVAVISFELATEKSLNASAGVSSHLRNWFSASVLPVPVTYEFGETAYALSVKPISDDSYVVTAGEESCEVTLGSLEENEAILVVDGSTRTVRFHEEQEGVLHASCGAMSAIFKDRIRISASDDEAGGSGTVTAPMHGALLEVLVTAGDPVKTGDTLAVLEAMKMQHQILAEVDGTVKEVAAEAGAQVAAGDLLVEIEAEGE